MEVVPMDQSQLGGILVIRCFDGSQWEIEHVLEELYLSQLVEMSFDLDPRFRLLYVGGIPRPSGEMNQRLLELKEAGLVYEVRWGRDWKWVDGQWELQTDVL
jgi:hypothetical protein